MALSTQPYKGTRDFYPDEMRFRQWMFGKLRHVVETFGFQEYDGPMLEPFELYAAKSGEEIVNQQLYWLVDRGERKMAVRPEMTPTLARMVAGQLHELPKPVRWFSIPNLWRYERPQRGRLREHWQLNVDILGGDPILADAEILTIAKELLSSFGGDEKIEIRVNHRGLVDHFFTQKVGLTAELGLKVTKALDARAKIGEEAFDKWLLELGITGSQRAELEKFFSLSFAEMKREYPCKGVEDLEALFKNLEESNVKEQIVFDPMILRGLDYYTATVFEIYDTSPENNRAMFGGGRYDNLIGLFGKNQLSGVGFGMGDVTLQNFLETHKLIPDLGSGVDVVVTLPKLEFRSNSEFIARSLRKAGLRVVTPLEVGSFKSQLKLADKFKAKYAVILGEEELKEKKVVLKNLKTGDQVTCPMDKVLDHIS